MAAKKVAAKKVAAKKDYLEMTREELEKELVSRGFEEADLVDLEADDLIAQLKSDDLNSGSGPSDSSASDDEEEAPQKGAKVSDSGIKGKFVDVIQGEQYIRTYSEADHGSDFMDLAKEFVSKDGRRSLAKDGQVQVIRVQYRIENKKTKEWQMMEERFTDRKAATAFRNGLPGNIKIVVLFK